LQAGLPASGVVLIGMINGFGGGFLRDIAVGNTPVVLNDWTTQAGLPHTETE